MTHRRHSTSSPLLSLAILLGLAAFSLPASADTNECMAWVHSSVNRWYFGGCIEEKRGPIPAANVNAFASNAEDCAQLNVTDSRSLQNRIASGNWCKTGLTIGYVFFWQTAVNGDGICDGLQESGQNSPADCCDQWTPCSQSFRNQGVKYCRQFAYIDGTSGVIGPYIWLADATPYCDESSEIGHMYYKCQQTCGVCSAIPNNWTSSGCVF